jgi:Spy/CpxP family protein refolding chaperone
MRWRGKMASPVTQLNNSPNEKNLTMKKTFMATIFFLILVDLIFLAFMGFWAVDASAQRGGWMSPGMYSGIMRGREDPGMMSGPPGMGGEGRRPERMREDEHPFWVYLIGLGLDDKQNQKIKEIRNKLLKETIKQRIDEQLIGIEMNELLDKDPVDLNTVEAVLKRKESINITMDLTFIRAREEVKSLLTPDQRKKLMTMLKRRPLMKGEPHGPFDG